MFSNFKRRVLVISLLVLLPLFVSPVLSKVEEKVDTGLLKGLEWRLVGPYRGGRVTTVAGVVGKPMLYYMGATGGGVPQIETRVEPKLKRSR